MTRNTAQRDQGPTRGTQGKGHSRRNVVVRQRKPSLPIKAQTKVCAVAVSAHSSGGGLGQDRKDRGRVFGLEREKWNGQYSQLTWMGTGNAEKIGK